MEEARNEPRKNNATSKKKFSGILTATKPQKKKAMETLRKTSTGTWLETSSETSTRTARIKGEKRLK